MKFQGFWGVGISGICGVELTDFGVEFQAFCGVNFRHFAGRISGISRGEFQGFWGEFREGNSERSARNFTEFCVE